MTTQFIVNHLWQSSCFALLAGLLTVVLRKNSPKVRYWVWLSASVKFLAPFALLVSLGGVVPRTAQRPVSVPTPVFPDALVQMAEPFSATSGVDVTAHAQLGWVPVAMGIAWGLGFLAIMLVRCRSWVRIRATLRASAPIDLPIPVPAFITPSVEEPGIVGLLRSVLVLPIQLLENLNPGQLAAILTHELCHVRRRDNLFAAVHMFVEAIFWFHPLVWWIGSRMVEERELACDEEVLRAGCEPVDYLQGILKVCQLYTESPLPCIAGVTGADIKKRLRAILAGTIPHELSAVRKAVLAVIGLAALVAPVAVGIVNAPFIQAQTARSAAPKFEVASIRRCDGPRPGNLLSSSPGSLRFNCGTVAQVIQQAYTRRGANGRPLFPPLVVRIEGGPAWINTDRYEINAKAENNASWPVMLGPMMEALLEDRFKLKLRPETREIPAYGLVLSKDDAKLRKLEETNCTPLDLTKPFDPTAPYVTPPPLESGQKPACPGISIAGRAQTQSYTVTAKGAILAQLTSLYPIALDRPVINKTGIAGAFTFQLSFAMDETTNKLTLPPGDTPQAPSSDLGPSIFTALESELGLKLEKTTGPAEYLVIDRIERPSDN